MKQFIKSGSVLLSKSMNEKLQSELNYELFRCCCYDLDHAADLLIAAGADVNHDTGRVRNGWTCLHEAVFHQSHKVARLLVVAGAEAHAEDSNGHQPLDIAIDNKNKKIITLLVLHQHG
jgi:ankyrin repeat protein